MGQTGSMVRVVSWWGDRGVMEVRQADLEGKRKGGGSLVTVGFGGWVGGGGGVVIFRG